MELIIRKTKPNDPESCFQIRDGVLILGHVEAGEMMNIAHRIIVIQHAALDATKDRGEG